MKKDYYYLWSLRSIQDSIEEIEHSDRVQDVTRIQMCILHPSSEHCYHDDDDDVAFAPSTAWDSLGRAISNLRSLTTLQVWEKDCHLNGHQSKLGHVLPHLWNKNLRTLYIRDQDELTQETAARVVAALDNFMSLTVFIMSKHRSSALVVDDQGMVSEIKAMRILMEGLSIIQKVKELRLEGWAVDHMALKSIFRHQQQLETLRLEAVLVVTSTEEDCDVALDAFSTNTSLRFLELCPHGCALVGTFYKRLCEERRCTTARRGSGMTLRLVGLSESLFCSMFWSFGSKVWHNINNNNSYYYSPPLVLEELDLSSCSSYTFASNETLSLLLGGGSLIVRRLRLGFHMLSASTESARSLLKTIFHGNEKTPTLSHQVREVSFFGLKKEAASTLLDECLPTTTTVVDWLEICVPPPTTDNALQVVSKVLQCVRLHNTQLREIRCEAWAEKQPQLWRAVEQVCLINRLLDQFTPPPPSLIPEILYAFLGRQRQELASYNSVYHLLVSTDVWHPQSSCNNNNAISNLPKSWGDLSQCNQFWSQETTNWQRRRKDSALQPPTKQQTH